MSVQSVVRSMSNVLVLGVALAVASSTQGVKSEVMLVTSSVGDTIQPCQFSGPCPTTTEFQIEASTVEQI